MRNFDNDLNENIKRFKRNKLFILLSLSIGVVVFVIIVLSMTTYWTNKNKEYSDIKLSTSLNGKIQIFKKNRGAIYFILSNGKKFKTGGSRNYNYEIANINSFIWEGDSIVKYKGNDTLFIYRDAEEFIFILDKTINKKLR